MNYKDLLINIDEIWLKGKNRKWYANKLRDQIINVFDRYHGPAKLQQEGPKFFAKSEEPFSRETLSALARISGIRSLNPCLRCENDVEKIKETALENINSHVSSPSTFRVESKRSDKNFPLTSMELSRQVGGFLKKHGPGLTVSMDEPDITVSLRVLFEGCFISTEKIPAMGGVPVPSSGRAITLLSGGFDSPAAAYMMYRRGLQQTMAFFHAYPYVGNEVVDKIMRLASVLATYQSRTKLYILPFGEIQKKIGDNCREDYRTLLFRQYMVRVSAELAKKEKAKALVMGDSLAQVSSQTLENISILDRTTELPILRPLVGHNKHEILAIAKQAGTHDISIEQQDDACATFAPRHPVIRGQWDYTNSFYQDFPMQEEIFRCIDDAKMIRFNVKGEKVEERKTTEDLFDLSSL